ncbi:hypothetical protein BSKO_06261 [Bryopsis sp. KO-2023]|nr:hypothetical protein BSKO_06261 [Bryopsis sp. KO-2023]
MATSTIGFPRIGANRELKRALESYWKGASSLSDLQKVYAEVESAALKSQGDLGIALVGLDGTYYDQVLDWTFFLGLAPDRFKGMSGMDQYFAMARGAEGAQALDMSKFFDTNYHYMVPELSEASQPKPDFSMFIEKVKRSQALLGKEKAVPMVFGPVSYVKLANSKVALDEMVSRLLPAYTKLFEELKALGVPEVQMHEPALVLSDANTMKAACETVYKKLSESGVPINLVTYYDDVGEAYPWLVTLPVAAISLDFCGVPGAAVKPQTLELMKKHGFPKEKRLGAGIVDGRSVYGSAEEATAVLKELKALGITNICVQSSVSLQHLPYSLDPETKLPEGIKPRLAFASEKIAEIVKVAKEGAAGAVPAAGVAKELNLERKMFDRPEPFDKRREAQVDMPAFPTTTIGSFPQTSEIRVARNKFKKGVISASEYKEQMMMHISYAIGVQDGLGLDVLVHGEAERTDMVEYFGEKMEGICFTLNGWVQSYGSRCTRPPIFYADISRPSPMTVEEFKWAQDLTPKPVKGMLTGPVTILNWSFPRKDIPRSAQAFQLGLALREEVKDLEAAGCRVIQVDEPAIREGLPLKKDRWTGYLEWAVDAFRLTCAVAAPATQIVTHMCYSSFEDILEAIDRMDADVLTIENSRSDNEMIHALAKYNYSRDIGAGCYDVHSPVVPTVAFLAGKIRSFFKETDILKGHPERIWVNPDCGLKTRNWKEVVPALKNMVEAAHIVRKEVSA